MAIQTELNLVTSINNAGKALRDLSALSKSMDKLGQSTTNLEKDFNKAGNAAQRASKPMGNFFAMIGKNLLPAAGIAGLGLAMQQFGQSTLIAAGQFEQTTVAFETMFDTAEEGRQRLEELAEFARITPFTLQDVEKNAKLLFAMGVESEKLIPTMDMLGNVASGVGAPIENIALAFGQVRTANQLYGTELRQFVNNGVPLIQELAKQFNVTEAQVRKMTENGQIGFSDVETAFQSMTSEGGKFFNLMQKQSKTFLGLISNLQDGVEIMQRNVGENFIQLGKDITRGLIDIVENELPFFVESFTNSFGNLLSSTISIGNSMIKAFDSAWQGIIGVFNSGSKESLGILQSMLVAIESFTLGLRLLFESASDGIEFLGRTIGNLASNSSDKFSNIKSDFVDLSSQTRESLSLIGNSFSDLGYRIEEARGNTKSSVELTEDALKKLAETTTKSLDDTKKPIADLGGKVQDLAGKYSTAAENIKDSLKKVEQDHKKNMTKIRDEIKDTRNELADLEKSFKIEQQEGRVDFATEFAEQEQLVKDLENEIIKTRRDGDIEQINNLQARLSNERQSLEEAKEFLAQIRSEDLQEEQLLQDAILAAKNRARNTDFTNFLNDFKLRKAAEEQAFQEEKVRLEQKLEALETELKQEQLLYRLAAGRIKATQSSIKDHFQDVMTATTQIVKNETDKQIDMFNRLAEAAKRASSAFGGSSLRGISGARADGGPVSAGGTYLVGERGPELFTPRTNGSIISNENMRSSGMGSNITVNISGVFGSDAAEEIGDMVVEKLAASTAF